MQDSVRATLRRAALVDRGKAPTPDPVEDFGFWHPPAAVLGAWFALKNWHVLPVAGGWLDQPEHWRDDLLTAQAVYNDESARLDDGGPTMNDLMQQDDLPRLPMFGE